MRPCSAEYRGAEISWQRTYCDVRDVTVRRNADGCLILPENIELAYLARDDPLRFHDGGIGGVHGNDGCDGARRLVFEFRLPREGVVCAIVQRNSVIFKDNPHFLAVESGVVGIDAGGIESIYLVCACICDEPRVLPRLVRCSNNIERDPRARYCGCSRATIFNWKSTASDL